MAEPADAESITRLINAAFEVERFFMDGDRISAAEVRARLEAGRFILAEDGALAGCVYVELHAERAHLGLLSVQPLRQRSGIGKRLMAAAEAHCHAAGCRVMELCIVNLRKELPGFYRRLGYAESGTSPSPEDAHPKLPCHFVNMSKPLAAAVTFREDPL